ncbi:iroquois-class homeodomain protein irx-5-like [Halichondria panicea]|uniref:iroquois-class homeodomain protein irx-5-like n=1 Tax=Halichondria panicea TaxID=6063 RepID=UPI00312BC0B9
MNDPSLSRLEKLHRAPAGYHSYRPVDCRTRMRNTAILVKWIEEHQSNPYPTKAEKQYLGYYSGMNLTQLSTWFANARRRIKKIGMKIWLEGRSTFTVDLFSTPSQSARTVSMASSDSGYHGSVSGSYGASSYLYPQALNSTYSSNQTSAASLSNLSAIRGQSLLGNGQQPTINNVYSPDSSTAYCSTISSSSLYGAPQQRSTFAQPLIGVPNPNWPAMLPSSASQVLHTTSALSSLPLQRQSSQNIAPLHSPLTAQVYSSDPLRSQTSLDMNDGSYNCLQQQHSPDSQILPECASSEPTMLQESPKTLYHSHTE